MALHLLLFMELGRRNLMFTDAVSATHGIIVSVLECVALTSLNGLLFSFVPTAPFLIPFLGIITDTRIRALLIMA